MGLIRRVAGIIGRPRPTLAELAARPAWVDTWLLILSAWALCGWWLLSSDIGQQALVDERVRVIETLGGTVSDDEYKALRAEPPWWVYFTSGSRILMTPPLTIAVALALWLVARVDDGEVRFSQTLAMAVHASVVLLLGQLIATPIHVIRESLTSPLNLAAVLPLMEEGTLATRFAGTLDLFAIWWAGLLAFGLSVLTRRPVTRYGWPIVALFLTFAAAATAVTSAVGGT
jgi:hypothetical protein